MRDFELLDKALKWIDAVESGKSKYYVDDIQTVSGGYTFQIIHGSKSMRFLCMQKAFLSIFMRLNMIVVAQRRYCLIKNY